jgi:hypothetical protein
MAPYIDPKILMNSKVYIVLIVLTDRKRSADNPQIFTDFSQIINQTIS